MKQTQAKTTNVEALDAAIAELRAALHQAIRDQLSTQPAVDKADTDYNRLAGLKYGGASVQPALDAAAGQLDRATRAHDEASRAVTALHLQIGELHNQQLQAERQDHELELRTISAELEPLGAELDALLAATANKLDIYIAKANRAANLRKWAGYGTFRTTKALAVDVLRGYLFRVLSPAFGPPDMAHAELLSFESIGRVVGRIPVRDKDTAA